MGISKQLVRLLSCLFISPIALQTYAIDVPQVIQDAVYPLFADPTPPRSETPIIMVSQTHWSHIEKVAAIATELAQRDYPVTLIVGRMYEKYVSGLHPKINFSAAQGGDDKMSEEDTKTWMSLEPGSREQAVFIMKKVLVDGMPLAHNTLQAELQKFREQYGDSKPLITIYDASWSGHHPILLGAPGIRPNVSIALSLAPLTLDSEDTFPFRYGKPPHAGPDAKAIHSEANKRFLEDPFTREMSEAWWAKLEELGCTQRDIPHMLHSMDSISDHLLTMGIPEFEFPRSDLRPNVRYFGGFKKVGRDGGEEEPKFPNWWDDLTKAKEEGKKIVAVSQGTVEMNMNDLVLPTIEALKNRDDIILVATFVVMEPEDVPDLVVPDNTRVARFVPYDQLLPLVDVLVSNGGYGAVQQALRVGVPMVVGGEGQDKPTTNAIVEWSGVGLNLGERQPGADKIRDAVNEVLENNKYKMKVNELSRKFDDYDVGEVTDKLVQDVVKDWVSKKQAMKEEPKDEL